MNPTPCNREKSEFSRRSFVRSSAAWTIGCFAGCRMAPLRSSYSVPLLGDVHYDRPPIDTFHSEFAVNSVTRTVKGRDIQGTPVVIGDKPSDFGRCRVNPRAPRDAEVDALYAEYEPGMRRYYTAEAAGHAELLFSDGGVRANYYGLDSVTPCASFTIRGS